MYEYICKNCKKIFKNSNKNKKYCSRKCYGESNRGENNPAKRIEVRNKIILQNTGKKCPTERKLKISKTLKNKFEKK